MEPLDDPAIKIRSLQISENVRLNLWLGPNITLGMEQLKEISSIQNCQMCLFKRCKCCVIQHALSEYTEYVQLPTVMMYGRTVYILTASITVSHVLFYNILVIS